MAHILYLHGFLSSPLSQKAQLIQAWMAKKRPDLKFTCPQLSSYPSEALAQIKSCINETSAPLYVIGSSLGGFWASHVIESGWAEKAVLINPAVSPHLRFTDRVGIPQKSYYSDDVYTLETADLDFLGQCESETLKNPDRYWVLLQTGDEVLDYRMAAERYASARVSIEEGGDHSFIGFDRHFDDIIRFFEASQ